MAFARKLKFELHQFPAPISLAASLNDTFVYKAFDTDGQCSSVASSGWHIRLQSIWHRWSMLFNKLQMVWMLDVWHTSRHTQPDWLTSLKKKRNVSTIKVSLNGKQKIWKWTSTYNLQKKTTFQMPHQIFAIQKHALKLRFPPSKGIVSSCPLLPSKGKHWKMPAAYSPNANTIIEGMITAFNWN